MRLAQIFLSMLFLVVTITSYSQETAAPAVPELFSPTDGATGIATNPTLSWKESSGADSYTIQISTNSDMSSPVVNQSGITGTSYSASGLDNGTQYYWQVNATNAGGTSGWSSVWNFTTIVAAPATPTLSSPPNGATGVSTTPTLSWNTVSEATRYEVEVHSNSGFTNIVYQNTNVTGTSVTVSPALQNNTQYYWRVRAVNDGGESSWSSRNFTTIAAAPSSPTLVSPNNGATGVSTTPTLSWNTVSEATRYEVEVHSNSGFTNIVYQNTNVTGTSVTVSPALQNNTQYYWRVRAVNDGGESSWSSRNFTTIAAAPSSPTLVSPPNGATGVSTTPTLSWNTVSEATRYEVEVHSNSGFTNIVYQNTNVTGTSVTVSPALQNNTQYYWRVRAVNDGGESSWSSRNFTTIAAAPSSPTLVSPPNGATGVSTTPTLSWNTVSEATRYEVEVHSNSGFTNIVYQNTNVTGTSVTVSPALQNNTQYYWRVRAVNDGGESSWSSRNFTTTTLPPSVTTQAVTNITTTTATGNGNITNLGIPAATQHGHVWSTSQNPTTSNSKTELGVPSSTGAYTSALTGLSPGMIYYVRAYATNTTGTVYGDQVQFTTSTTPPSVTTQAVSNVTTTTATGNGNVTNLGAPAATQHGHVWSTSQNPTTSNSKTELGAPSSTGAYTSSITGLSAGTTYYVRAYATNANNTVYGTQVQFTTSTTPPSVTTQAVSNITTTTATGNGNITNLGSPAATQHGHVWNTSQNPTTSNSKTELGAPSSTGAYTSSLTGLSPGTTYYVRAYATNTTGTVYGTQVQFTTSTIPPSVTTQAVTNITTTTATGNGNITNLGIPAATQHGHVWSTSQNPTTSNSKTELGVPSSTGAYTSALTGLSPGMIYYVRAYATNTTGTVYGAQVQFTTSTTPPSVTTQAVSNITTTTATGNGNVTNLGSPAATQHGHVWSTSQNPTTSDSKTELGAPSGTGSYTSSMAGLSPGMIYYVRAYATNANNTVYGTQVQFTTSTTPPSVTTQAVSNITTTTATGNGNVTNLGSPAATQHGHVWSTSQNPTTSDSKTELGAPSGTGSYTSSMAGLSPGMIYYVRAYATNANNTVYGTQVQFTTSTTPPSVTTQAVSNVTTTTATGNGNVTNLGSPAATQHGHVWSTSQNPTTSNSKTELGAPSSTGVYTSSLTGLSPGTTYYVRAYATNTTGTVYGTQVQFTTSTIPPSVTTQAVSNITTTTATGNGNITNLGSPAATQHGHVWNTSQNPTTSNSKTELGAPSSTGAYTSSLTGLSPGTTYYVRAYAINASGTVYGTQVQFTTSTIPPSVTTQAVSNITTTTATGNGNVTNLGAPGATQHGHVWNTSQNPTTSNSKTEQGAPSSTGAYTSSLTGLSPGTTYYIRAYATSTTGTVYGNQVQFTTNRLPSVTTSNTTNIRDISASLNGIVTDIGQPPLSEHGFVWGISQNPTVNNNKINLGAKTSTGPITSDINGLSPGTQYYVRAYAISEDEIFYGNQVSFTTTTPSKLLFHQQPSNTQAGQSITPAIEVHILDGYNNLATGYTGNVTIAIFPNPNNILLEGTKVKGAVNGVVTFNDLKINKAGTGYTLRATATNLTPDTSAAFNITVGPAVKLLFEREPSNTRAGDVITPAVVVHAVDQFNNLVTGYNGSVTIAIFPNPGNVLLEGTKVKNAVSGIVTFNDLKINKAGTGYTLRATATNLTPDTSAAFNITVGPAAKLLFEREPSNTRAGDVITPAVVVHAVDQFNNLVTGYNGSVTIAIFPNPDNVLLEGTKVKNASSGVVTFNDLKINKAGTGYTLRVTATNLTPDTSAAFNITVGPAAKLLFEREPSNTRAGDVITPAVVVHAVDQFNNLVTGYNGSVTIAIFPNPDNVLLDGTKVKNAASGVVTFNDLKISKAGTGYTLRATATNLTPDTSAAFNITVGPAVKLLFEREPSNTRAGDVITPAVVVHAVDQFNNLVTGYNGSVTIAIFPNPDNVLLEGTRIKNASSGVVTFNDLKISKAGTGYTLRVTAANLTPDTSAAFNITVGPAVKLLFEREPSNTRAGDVITPAVVVHAVDQFNNLVTGYNGSVTIAIFPNPDNVLLDGTKVKNAVSGVVTFNDLKISKAGTGYTLRVTAANLTPDTSAAFNITVGPAVKLLFEREPSNTRAGDVITPAVVVHAVDQFNNLVTGYNGSVTIAIFPNPDNVLLEGTKVKNASSGVVTFNDLKISKAGTGYTLRVTATNLTPDTSAAFNITVGPAAKLLFEREPSNTRAGDVITPAVVVHAVDQFNNLVTGYNGSVTIAIFPNPDNVLLDGTKVKNAVSGVVTFNDLKISKAGTGYTLQVTAANLTPDTSAAFDILPSGPAILLKVSGDNQDGLINTALEAPLIVKVTDEFNNPVSSITVTFEITGAPETAFGQKLENTTDETDAEGIAQTILIMGNIDGAYRVTASATGLNEVIFLATIATVRISGTVTEAGVGLIDVDVVLTWEGFTQPTRTSATGSYLIPGIPRGAKNITITASKSGYLFEPEEFIISGPVVNHVTDVDFKTIPPFAPALVSPENNIVELPANVTIEWSQTERTDHYNIQVAGISDFNSGIFADVDTVLTISYQLKNMEYGQTYYWRVRAVNPSGYGAWSEVWNFSIVPTVTHLITVRSGWNMVSSYVEPLDTSASSMFASIVDNLIIAKDGAGNSFIPLYGIDQIRTWHSSNGYQIYIYPDDDQLVVYGIEIKPEKNPIDLQSGWNITGYLRNSIMHVQDAFETIQDNLIIVKNNAGQVYIPPGVFGPDMILTIPGGSIMPGEGYQMYLSGNSTLLYPTNGNTTSQQQIAKEIDAQKKEVEIVAQPAKYIIDGMTGNNATIIVESDLLAGGNEIGVFTESGNLVGSGVVDNKHTAVITVWGEDELSDETGIGAAINENMSLKTWCYDAEKETDIIITSIKNILVESDTISQLRYKPDAVLHVQIDLNNQIPEEYVLYQNYPNPFNPTTTIEYAIKQDSYVVLEIFNVLGQQIETLVREDQVAGRYKVGFNGSYLPSGTYFYRLHTQEFTKTKRFILLK
jgi:hypothetical protein